MSQVGTLSYGLRKNLIKLEFTVRVNVLAVQEGFSLNIVDLVIDSGIDNYRLFLVFKRSAILPGADFHRVPTLACLKEKSRNLEPVLSLFCLCSHTPQAPLKIGVPASLKSRFFCKALSLWEMFARH
jgi:hypothetical protein